MSRSIFRSAVTGTDGTIDPGYLGLFVVMLMVLGTIPGAMFLAAVRMYLDPAHPLDLTGIAAVIAAAGASFGTAAGGVGLFRMGDKPHADTTTTTATQTTVLTPQVA
jgi:hypothetical protein